MLFFHLKLTEFSPKIDGFSKRERIFRPKATMFLGQKQLRFSPKVTMFFPESVADFHPKVTRFSTESSGSFLIKIDGVFS